MLELGYAFSELANWNRKSSEILQKVTPIMRELDQLDESNLTDAFIHKVEDIRHNHLKIHESVYGRVYKTYKNGLREVLDCLAKEDENANHPKHHRLASSPFQYTLLE